MDLFQVILFAALVIGIMLIIISMFLFNRENQNTAVDYLERSNTIKAIDASINELDKTMEEFENLSKQAFEELDEKYQEILFLYNLLNEKKQEIADLYYTDEKQVKKKSIRQDGPSVNHRLISQKYSNPKAKEINELMDQGLDITEIAKQMNMGKGEVRLIVELAKGNVS